MLRLMRAGSRAGSPAPLVRLIAALIILGMLVAAAPFLAGIFTWLAGLL